MFKFIIDENFKRFLSVLILFCLYQVFVSIVIKNELTGAIAIIKYVVGNIWRIFGIFTAIPIYFFIQYSSDRFFKILLYVSLTIYTFYFTTLLTPIKLIPVYSSSREFVEASRYHFRYAYFLEVFLEIALVAVLLGLKEKKLRLVKITGVMIFIAKILTLTRGSIIATVGRMFIVVFLVKDFYRKDYVKTIMKYFGGGIILISLLTLFSFDTSKNVFNTFHQTFFGDEEVVVETRTVIELPSLLKLFRESPVLGQGMLPNFYSGGVESKTTYGVVDFAAVGNLAIFGLLGIVLYLSRYVIFIRDLKRFLRYQKRFPIFSFLSMDQQLLIIWSITSIISSIVFTLHNFSGELVRGRDYVAVGVTYGLFYGIYNVYKKRLISHGG